MTSRLPAPEGRPWILLDCDDVKLDFLGTPSAEGPPTGFAHYLHTVHGIETRGKPASWGLSCWTGADGDITRKMVQDFIENHEGFGRLHPMEGAVAAIASLHAMGYRIASITACSSSSQARARRLDNLQQIFGNQIDILHMVPLGGSKLDILSSYPRSIWVDDNPGNAAAGAALGHRSLLFPADHNRVEQASPPDGVEPIGGWSDVLRIAQEEMSLEIASDSEEPESP